MPSPQFSGWQRKLLKAFAYGTVMQMGTLPLFAPEAAAAAPATSTVAAVTSVEPALRPAAGMVSGGATSPRKIEPTYTIQVGLENEIFPVFANHAALQPRDERTWGTVAVTVRNSTDAPLRNRIAVQVRGWSDQEIQIAEMAAGDVRTVLFAPSFLPRLYQNQELTAATVDVQVSDMGGRTVFEQTVPVHLRAADDMYWGQNFKFAPFIASWITPHDPRVELVLSHAKEFVPNRRLPGYEDWKDEAGQERETEIEARAIYRALQAGRVSYVKSSITFGGNNEVSERVRMPRESLRQSAANCIDGVVLFASLFENLGMAPAVVVVPGHAYVGVRVARGSSRYLYFDTALTGRASFEAAVAAAERGLAKYPQSQILSVRVDDARRAGIFPMPQGATTADANLTADFPVDDSEPISKAAPVPAGR